MSEMVSFFNDHPEYELISYSYKTKDVLTAVYYSYNNTKKYIMNYVEEKYLN